MKISFTLPASEEDDDVEIIKNVGDYDWEIEIYNEYSVRVKVNPLSKVIEIERKLKELEESGFIATIHTDF